MSGRPEFAKLSEIDPARPETWQNSPFLTFDIDWACDEILADTIDIVESYGVAATWFVTHDTPLLERLRSNPFFELGIHPNFNSLLEGDLSKGANASEVLDRILAVVPEAKCVRSHSMTQSSLLLSLFRQKGLTHDCNHFIPETFWGPLEPWCLWNGLIKAPYFWEDDVHCLYKSRIELDELLARQGLRIFDFHPIHVFLNTEDITRYEKTRPIHSCHADLLLHRNERVTGARNHLITLLRSAT